MADQKISQLPAATTPTGAEVVPVLQGGANKRATANELAAPAVAAHEAANDPHPQYQTQAESDARYATAAQGTDSREWSAATIGQAEAEAGTATTRRAFTAERVFQAIAAWWAASSAKTKLDGIAAGAEVNVNADWNASSGDAQILNKPTLGGAAALNVGTSAGTIAAGDDSRITGALSSATAASTYQPLDSDLTAIAALSTTSFGRSLLTQADAAATRTTIGAGTSSVAVSNATPQALGSASAGTSADAARADHVHAPSSVVTTSAAGLAPATSFSTITYAADVELDLATLDGQYRTISLTGNLSLTSTNRAAGRRIVLRLICDSTQRTLTFPSGWVFVGTKPANIAASKTAILSVTWFGTATTDAVAAYAVQS
jgi:hypothetical protein